MARAKHRTLILEKEKIGGQITLTNEVVNYPGVFKATGEELTKGMAKQAIDFGAEIRMENVISLDLEGDIKKVKTASAEYQALSVFIATGAHPRKLNFKGEKEYMGKGIAYCATCDGEFFTGKDIFVIGGGFAAAEEAMFLTRFSENVTMIVREEEMTCAETIIDKVKNHTPKIKIHYNTEIKEITGDNLPKRIEFVNNVTNETWEYKNDKDIFGIFIFAGYIPNTELLKQSNVDITMNNQGYIVVDNNKKTNIPGVYAIGDICEKELRQVVTAVSDGATASTNAEHYINGLHKKHEIPALFKEKENNTKKEETPKQTNTNVNDGKYITEDMKRQLKNLFDSLTKKVVITGNIYDDNTSKELKTMLFEMDNISKNIEIIIEEKQKQENVNNTCYITLGERLQDGTIKNVGYKFYGIPGGHEFTAFVVTIYKVFGEKVELNDELISRITNLKGRINVDIVISLTCTKCPDLIMEFAKVLKEATNNNIDIDLNIYDIAFAEEKREKYSILSVPCIIINDDIVDFGKKDASEIVTLLEKVK